MRLTFIYEKLIDAWRFFLLFLKTAVIADNNSVELIDMKEKKRQTYRGRYGKVPFN